MLKSAKYRKKTSALAVIDNWRKWHIRGVFPVRARDLITWAENTQPYAFVEVNFQRPPRALQTLASQWPLVKLHAYVQGKGFDR
jgi:hypothetical protein